jgi:hypothetical protein
VSSRVFFEILAGMVCSSVLKLYPIDQEVVHNTGAEEWWATGCLLEEIVC